MVKSEFESSLVLKPTSKVTKSVYPNLKNLKNLALQPWSSHHSLSLYGKGQSVNAAMNLSFLIFESISESMFKAGNTWKVGPF